MAKRKREEAGRESAESGETRKLKKAKQPQSNPDDVPKSLADTAEPGIDVERRAATENSEILEEDERRAMKRLKKNEKKKRLREEAELKIGMAKFTENKGDDSKKESQGSKDVSDRDRRKGAKKERREKEKISRRAKSQNEPGKNAAGVVTTVRERPQSTDGGVFKKQRQGQEARTMIRRQKMQNEWKSSEPTGGHILDLDPVFSRDEQYLLVAYNTTVIVYSTSTSLPVRHLKVKNGDRISAVSLSPFTDTYLYVSVLSGAIEKWDWSEGLRLARWKVPYQVCSLTTSVHNEESVASDVVYTTDKKEGGVWSIAAHLLTKDVKSTRTEDTTLLTYKNPLSSLKVLDSGRFIVATSGSQLILGSSDMREPWKLQDLSYTWRIVDCPEWIVSIDTRVIHPEEAAKSNKGGSRGSSVLDIAVGGLKGSIHIYENLLGKLIRKEQPATKDAVEDINSRRLHWHRNAVLSLKWSLDGNYLISGGHETVMILWQLETGHKQHLPHLGASVESIVVSPFGASYGVRLADNSAMILSTSELKPTFSIAGIQIPRVKNHSFDELPFTPSVDDPLQDKRATAQSKVPATISASRPGCLLLAVPPSTTVRGVSRVPLNASYLQSFDITAAQQISRQALTRTRITTLNMGPEQNTIEEPNVVHMQTSSDGKWLATVDEWMPPRRDVVQISFEEDKISQEQNFRKEIYLKFWSWNDEARVWELVSRIDNPHASQSGNPYKPGTVLELSSDPSSVGFATMGTDGILRTWKPAVRRRNGLDVRRKDGKTLTSWHCKHATSLGTSNFEDDNWPVGAKLAYSQDGSIIAAGLQSNSTSPIYFIDTYNGGIASVQTDLYSGILLGLGIINKYLITLSDMLCVWDLVNDELSYGISLHSFNLSSSNKTAMSHLAVDIRHGLFAVALPDVRHKAKIAIFDPTDAQPILQKSLTSTVTTLLPAIGRRGFYTIDSAAQIRTFGPITSTASLPVPKAEDTAVSTRGLNDIFGNGQGPRFLENGAGKESGPLTSGFGNVTQKSRQPNDDTVVVSQDRLAEVFDVGPSYAMPPLTELFEQVATLYNGRNTT